MSKKHKKGQQQGAEQQATTTTSIRIGTRVRCTDDNVEGRVTWANATSVKIRWDDGEEVTWRRDALADKPVAFIDEEQQAEQGVSVEPHPVPEAEPEAVAPEQAQPEPADDEHAAPEADPAEQARSESIDSPEVGPAAPGATGTPVAPESPAAEAPQVTEQQSEVTATAPQDAPEPSAEQKPAEPAAEATPPEAAPAKPKRTRQPKKAGGEAGPKKMSALDAAAKVLEETGQPMTTQEMIDTMAQKGLWSSPGGKTPAATLYSAILRELQTKGEQSRFIKIERGKFAYRSAR